MTNTILERPKEQSLQGRTALIVDDEPANLGVVSDYLESVGLGVLIARDGESGLEKARYARPDLILLDVLMPEMDGFETCRRLKADEALRDIPVIFMTALAEIEHKIKGFEVGAVDYIIKPFQHEELLARVTTHMHLRELTERLEVKVQERTEELLIANQRLRRVNEKLTREIGERKRAEESLKESEERFRALYEDNPSMYFTVDAQGAVLSVNAFGAEQLGYTVEELVGKSVFEVFHADDREAVQEHLSARLQNPGQIARWEFRKVRKDGSVLWVREAARAVRGGDGKPIVFVVCEDITERKWAEEEQERLLIQNQEQAWQMRQIMNTVPEGVLLLDADGRVVLANPVAERDLTMLADAKVGDILTGLGDCPLTELLASPPTKGLWHEVKAAARTFEVIARPMVNGPEAEEWVLVLRDVTQEREIQRRVQQQEQLAAIGQLAAGIAHDFNNIMSIIMMYAQMAARAKDLPAHIQERMVIINQQGQRATNLIQQILDFSRCGVLKRRPMGLIPFLKEQIRLLECTLPESIQISFSYERGDYAVNADPTRIQQVVMNLALNARDAMPEGGELRIGLEQMQVESREEAPLPGIGVGEWVQMTVRDSGTGIPPDVLPHVFDPFFTTKALGEGTGLGLAQVYGIIKQHEGYIDVMTEIGQGTTFIIYLPVLPVAEPGALPEETAALPQGQGETILVVEDDAAVREALVDSIESLNYRVLEAANGREALAVLEEQGQGVALVVSDLVMPEMGGQALFHVLKQYGLTLPMVMLSGHPMESELKSLQAQGLAGWLPKPPAMEQLAQLLAQALKGESK